MRLASGQRLGGADAVERGAGLRVENQHVAARDESDKPDQPRTRELGSFLTWHRLRSRRASPERGQEFEGLGESPNPSSGEARFGRSFSS